MCPAANTRRFGARASIAAARQSAKAKRWTTATRASTTYANALTIPPFRARRALRRRTHSRLGRNPLSSRSVLPGWPSSPRAPSPRTSRGATCQARSRGPRRDSPQLAGTPARHPSASSCVPPLLQRPRLEPRVDGDLFAPARMGLCFVRQLTKESGVFGRTQTIVHLELVQIALRRRLFLHRGPQPRGEFVTIDFQQL